MANWNFLVVDATTGQSITDATISGYVNTTPCPQNPWGGNANGCTSGSGYSLYIENSNGTSDPSSYDQTIPYSCIQTVSLTVTAPGYAEISDQFATGSITGDVGKTYQLEPLSTTAGASEASQAATSPAANANWSDPIVNWWSSSVGQATSSTEIILGILAVIAVAIVIAIVFIRV